MSDLVVLLKARNPARESPSSPEGFATALAAGLLDVCAARIAELTLAGVPLARCFDTLLVPARRQPGIVGLVRRIEGLAEMTRKAHRWPVVIAGRPEPGPASEMAMVAAIVRAHGFQTLASAPGTTASALASLALENEAVLVILTAAIDGVERLAAALPAAALLVLVLDSSQPADVHSFEELDRRLGSLPLPR